MAPLKFYGMLESPPCRAVLYVLKIANIEHEYHSINLSTGEHKTDEFKKINPAQKVPCIVDGDMHLGESRAIICYLVNKYLPADHSLYPNEPVKRAKIDELLYFDIGTLHAASSKLFFPLILGPVAKLDEVNEKAFKLALAQLEEKLNSNNSKKFILGDHVTVADLSISATLSLREACDYDISEFKLLSEYLERVKVSIPDYQEVVDKPVNNMRKFIKSVQERK